MGVAIFNIGQEVLSHNEINDEVCHEDNGHNGKLNDDYPSVVVLGVH